MRSLRFQGNQKASLSRRGNTCFRVFPPLLRPWSDRARTTASAEQNTTSEPLGAKVAPKRRGHGTIGSSGRAMAISAPGVLSRAPPSARQSAGTARVSPSKSNCRTQNRAENGLARLRSRGRGTAVRRHDRGDSTDAEIGIPNA